MFLEIGIGTTMIIIWGAVFIIAGVIEILTMDLSSVWFSVGSVFALIVAVFAEEEYVAQIIVFILSSIILMISLRPLFKRHLQKNEIKTNADSLVGKIANCTKAIVNGDRGEVKIEGKIWTAIANEDVLVGEKVTVLSIQGVKLVVRKN